MKYLLSCFTVCLLSFGFSNSVSAQDAPSKNQVAEFEVRGVCKMCKKRIEKAALIKGVKMATWDKNTQKLKVIYNAQKLEEKAIHTAVAGVGHDTETVVAEAAIYKKLPDCCAYRDGVKVH